MAEAVIEYGAHVFISSSSSERVERAVDSLCSSYPSARDRIIGYACDLGDENTVEENVVRLLSQVGQLDHIVYTAGDSNPPTPISEVTLETLQRARTVRYTGPIFVAKHASKYLRNSHESSIILTTGVVTEKPLLGWSAIAGPRAAVANLSKALALDLKPIRVNVVSLGAVDTGVWDQLDPGRKERLIGTLVEKSTTGRIAQPADVVEAYLYCMKDKNVTGSTVSTNGGVLLT